VLDEAHKLKRPQSARTKRFRRYTSEHPGCRVVALSGTMTSQTILDYAHFCELALGKGSPLPSGYHELVDWGGALDVDPLEPRAPGALMGFCAPGEGVREGYRRRLVETPGVIATEGEGFDGTIIVRQAPIRLPAKVEAVRERVTSTWEIGDQVITEATHFGRVMKQLSCGFYYEWRWPGDTPDQEWLEARRWWYRELRTFLQHRSKAGLDSRLLVERALKKGEVVGDIKDAWHAWSKVADRPEPETVAVWIDPFMVEAAKRWAKANKGGIIWYEHRTAFEHAFRDAGFPVYASGDDADEATEDVIVCSIRAQGTGKNLQYRYHRNLIISMTSSGDTLEQLIGRTHRPKQPEDEVIVDWFAHTPEMIRAYAKAKARAVYMQETTGQRQKILLAKEV